MRYETPEITASKPAIDAIQATPASKGMPNADSPSTGHDTVAAYEDWE